MIKLPWLKLKQVNLLLFLCILAVDGYIVAAPLLPGLTASLPAQNSAKLAALTRQLHEAPKPAQPNQLIIPKIGLSQLINEGRDTYAELDKGILRWPDGSTPDKGGNTVILGHSFTYTSPEGVFYFLDKLAVGDSMGILWHDKTYTYKVTEIKVVKAEEVSILNPTTKPTLTLYTCTLAYWPKYRFVIVSQLESVK